MMPWFRLYPEILKDPKIRRFNTIQKWLWITAMCEASQSSDRGKLFVADGIDYTDEDLAHAAGLPANEIELAKGFIEMCVTLKMMGRHADGGVTLTNFFDRQYEKPSDSPDKTRDRKRKQRAKEAAEKKVQGSKNTGVSTVPEGSQECHANVTPESNEVTPVHALDTDTESDSETDTETEEKETQPLLSASDHHVNVVVVGGRPLHVFKSVIDLYKHYFVYEPNPTIRQLLHTYLDDGIQMDALAWAMRNAAEKSKQWSFAKGTIDNFLAGGIRTAEQAELADQEFRQQKEQTANRKVVPILRSDKLPDSVQRQMEREQQGLARAAGERKTVNDVPELKAMLDELRQKQKGR